jgi:hypothetical protein
VLVGASGIPLNLCDLIRFRRECVLGVTVQSESSRAQVPQRASVHMEPGDAMAGETETVTRFFVRSCPLVGCSHKVTVCHTPGACNIAHLDNHTAS